MLKRSALFFIFSLIAIFLTGCWGAKEIDESAYPIALGLDKGFGGKIMISVAVANFSTPASYENQETARSGNNGVRVLSALAPGIFSGLNMINSVLERQLNLGHLKIVVISEALARDGIDKYLDAFVRWRQFRRTIYLAVTEGEAVNVIKNIIPQSQENPAKFLEMTLLTQRYTGYIPRGQFLDFYNAYKTKGESPIVPVIAPLGSEFQPQDKPAQTINLPLDDPGNSIAGRSPISGETPLQLLGTAVFKGGKMIYKLNGDETIALSLMRGEFRRAYLPIPDPEEPDKIIQVELSIIQKPRNIIKKEGNNIRVRTELTLLADILSIQSKIPYEKPAGITRIEQSVAAWVEKKCTAVLVKARTNGTDIFGFGETARWLFPDWPSWQRFDWTRAFKDLTLDLHVKVHVDRTGLIIQKNAVSEGIGQ